MALKVVPFVSDTTVPEMTLKSVPCMPGMFFASYSDSQIRQERKIGAFEQWTASEVETRRGSIESGEGLIDWLSKRWPTPESASIIDEENIQDIEDEDQDDAS